MYSLAQREELDSTMDDGTARLLHKTMKKVTGDYEILSFNTAISAMMVLVNHLAALEKVPREALEKLVLMLSPIAPHVCEESWSLLGHGETLAYEPWVEWDEELCVDNVVELGVQVNGKKRGSVELSKEADAEEAQAAALAIPGVFKFVDDKPIKKLIYVPGRIINIIV